MGNGAPRSSFLSVIGMSELFYPMPTKRACQSCHCLRRQSPWCECQSSGIPVYSLSINCLQIDGQPVSRVFLGKCLYYWLWSLSISRALTWCRALLAGRPADSRADRADQTPKVSVADYCAAGSKNRAITGRWLEIRNVSSCRTLASTRLIREL